MKKQIDYQLLATLGGGLLFNYLFYNDKQGLNLLLYSIFLVLIVLFNNELPKGKRLLIVGASHLFAGLMVVYNLSNLTLITWYVSLAVFIGFIHAQQLRSIFTVFLVTFLQLVTAPFNLFKKIINTRFGKLSIKPLLKPIKYIIIPIVVLFIFSMLYSAANPVFEKYLNQGLNIMISFLENIFNFLFAEISFKRIMHIILGVIVTAAIIISFKNNSIEKIELARKEDLIRVRKNKLKLTFLAELKGFFLGKLLNKKLALKTDYIIGIISLSALNLLLFALNGIDFSTLWLGKVSSFDDTYLSTQLHEGANSLIFSILLAMLVILYFFSGNLNFFSKNKTLKVLAYIWILQNTFLVFSVLIRDYHYINLSGLTYKRIGVLIFLLLCIIGLFTVYTKVAKQKTFFYLMKVNGQIWYILLLVFGLINWDVYIASYNINHRDSIALDLDHLMEMSDKTLPLLIKNKEILKTYVANVTYYQYIPTDVATVDTNTEVEVKIDNTPVKKITSEEIKQKQIENFNKDLKIRIKNFNYEWVNKTWLSWNFRDWQTAKYFKINKN